MITHSKGSLIVLQNSFLSPMLTTPITPINVGWKLEHVENAIAHYIYVWVTY